MRILITNDDGINAPGLAVLHSIAMDLAGADGEVWTVAPAFEQSGVGHCISYTHPTMISRFGDRRYAAEGSPADCVLAAIHDVMSETPPDLILSGVNRGNNAAENVLYSGTVGAAMEGALQGVRSIAMSQFYGPANRDLDDPFESARAHGAKVLRSILAADTWGEGPWGVFYNINFPPVSAEDTLGVRTAKMGWRSETSFAVAPAEAPSGRRFLWVTGGPQGNPTGPGTDVTANLDGYISVTPLTADLTAHAMLGSLAEKIDT